MPGGYAVNFKRGGFEFDASLHLLNGFGAGKTSYKWLQECGIDKKVKFLKPAYLYRSIFPDFDFKISQCNPEAYIDILGKFFPAEKEKIKKLFDLMFKIFYRIYDIGNNKISPTDFTEYINKTYQDVLDKFSINEKLAALISQVWPFTGLPPKQIPFLVFLSSFCDYIYSGGYYPEGGGQAIANALTESIKENGGTIIFRKTANKIIIKDNTVCGVATNDNEVFLSNSTISNIDAHTTFYNLVGPKYLSSSFFNEIDKLVPSISAFQVYLGLNAGLEKMGASDYTTFLNPNYDIELQYKASLENNLSEAPLEITFYNLLDKNGVSSNKSVMSIISLAGYDFWKNFTKDSYKKKKKEIADILIKRAACVIPRFFSYIDNMEIATPLTMERYTGNYKGAIYGWSQILSQYGSKRMKQKTLIKNLFLCGAWTKPAGGIAGVMQSGVIISNKILKRDTSNVRG